MCVCGRGAKAGSTLRCSQAVPHPSTNRALCRLTRSKEIRCIRHGMAASGNALPREGAREVEGLGGGHATPRVSGQRFEIVVSIPPVLGGGGQMPKEPRPSLASQRKPERARGSRREPEREPARARERERERERARLSQRESASSRSPLPFPQTVPTRARAKAHRAPQGKHRPKTPPREA